MGVTTQVSQLQVVQMFSVFSNEVAVVKNVDFQKPFYTASIDVGLVSKKTILYTMHSLLPKNSITDYCRIQERRCSQEMNIQYKKIPDTS